MARLVLLLTSPRVAPGLLSRDAWSALSGASAVLARGGNSSDGPETTDPTCAAIAESGILVTYLPYLAAASAPSLARALLERASGPESADVVWIGSDDGDPGLTDALATEVSRLPAPPDIEILVGSFDLPGSRLLDLVAVMDRLRGEGGCPWDAEQTHASLVPYLLEETYEAIEAIEAIDAPGADPSTARSHLVEELGDVLLQVAFHARIGEEDRLEPFDIDDVAAGIVEKLVRRHPHVFSDADAATAADVEAGWEQLKALEKPERASVLDGIPPALPALARATKVLSRLERAGRVDLVDEVLARDPSSLGVRLLEVVRASVHGEDAEAALRSVLRQLEQLAR